ncbi:MAG: hypothetical protein JRJ78_04220 [Deltaproteobacteria bacterium]|nr:hypothetical protein [Deltaproteobacteria bacterium]
MNFLNLNRFFLLLPLTTLFLFLAQGYAPCETVVPLERESLFCLYHKMSGKVIKDQDIEDLSAEEGRPFYSAYKPSELFTKKSLKAARKRLERLMRDLNGETLFIWLIECRAVSSRRGSRGLYLKPSVTGLPESTPFIRAKWQRNGRRRLLKIVNSLLPKVPDLWEGKTLRVKIHLKAVKTVEALEVRNIARQKVRVPIRYVLFEPLQAELAAEPSVHPNNLPPSFSRNLLSSRRQ